MAQKIVLEGVVGWEFGQTALRDLLPASGDLRVYIHSPGGDVVAGQALAGALRLHALEGRGDVETVGVGLVASIATIILLAGRRAALDSGAFFMIHNSSGGNWGGAKTLRDTASTLETIDKMLLDTYVSKIEKSGKKEAGTEAKIKKMMDAETWLTAQQALDLGLIDEIIEEPAAPALDASAMLGAIRDYKNAPAALVAMYSPAAPEVPEAAKDAPEVPEPEKSKSIVKPETEILNMKNAKKTFWEAFVAFLTGAKEDEVAIVETAPEQAPPAADKEPAAPEVDAVAPVAPVSPAPEPSAELVALQAKLAAQAAALEELQAKLAKQSAAPPVPPVSKPAEKPAEKGSFGAQFAHLFE
jgi:ATP-dependent Clp protease, protease subunit